ncbi:MAG: T9SS type A sorting domain-containing protein [Flavobacteriales bacterium]|nr:T9SS type A sorting domain-containing protein [Flavobacteriales bacterium]
MLPEPLRTNLFDNAKVNVSLYPNPSKGIFNLQLEKIERLDAIQIVDTNDKTISFKQKNTGIGQSRIEMELTSNGIYFMNLTIGEQRFINAF